MSEVVFSLADMTLSLVQESELELLMQWRNDPEVLTRMRDQKPVTMQQQQYWYEQQKKSSTQYFIVRYKSRPVGIINYKLLDTAQYEVGLAIGEADIRGSLVCFLVAMLQLDYAFSQLKAIRLVASVKEDNRAAIRFNQQLGYQILPSEEAGMVWMKLEQDNYQIARKRLERFCR